MLDTTHTTIAAHQNPLLEPWQQPYGLAPYDRIRPEHFPPAFDEAMGRHTAEIDDIAKQRGHPTFENTITALEKSGELLTR
ncbi:MAG: peptidase M3, partial [Chitinophagales bacterium]|nr:peptidase M3 [Hyphomicrobiales bacterium]